MFNTIMENKKLNEQLNKMKSLMIEQEVQEDMLDDIKDYLYGKVQGVSTKLGAAFDAGDSSGEIALTREGGHSHNRIVHAGGDQSGDADWCAFCM